MTRGSQQELARQKNKKRQSSSVKGKHWAAGTIVPQAQGHADHAAEAEKGKREGGSQVALELCVQPSCPWPVHLKPVPPRWGFLPQGSGPRTDGVPFAMSLQWVPFVLPSPQVASLPFSHSQKVRGLYFPSLFFFFFLWRSPHSFKISFVIAKKKKKKYKWNV